MERIEIRKVTRGFQITLPRAIRDKYNLKIGDAITLTETAEGFFLKALSNQHTAATRLKALLDQPLADSSASFTEEQVLEQVRQELKNFRHTR